MEKFNKFLFNSKDLLFFIIGGISGFGLNILTNSLSNNLIGGILIFICSIILFYFYKRWLGNIDEFEYYITHSKWNKFYPKDIWICEDNNDYQLELGECITDKFNEKWSNKTLDNENNASYKLYVKKNGVIVRDFTWCYLDGYRILMPLPEVKDGDYFIEKNSLKYKMLLKIGGFGRFYRNADDLLKSLNIKIF